MRNRGKTFEAELKSSMENAGLLVERIPDKVYWNGYRMCSDETPADFLAFMPTEQLKGMMVEAKATSTRRLACDRLRQHQHDALCQFERFHPDMHGYVAINFYDKDNIRKMNNCFMVPIYVWDAHFSGTKKSISMDDCSQYPGVVMCNRIKGSMYDMSGLF